MEPTIAGKGIDYGYDCEHEINVADTNWVMEQLMSNIGEEFRLLLLDWLREYGPREGVRVRTPSVLIEEGHRHIRQPLLKAIEEQHKIYPTGSATPAIDLATRIKDDKRHLLLDDSPAHIVVPPHKYPTLTGSFGEHRWNPCDYDSELCAAITEKICAAKAQDYTDSVEMIRSLMPEDLCMYMVTHNVWLPGNMHPEQVEAYDYAEECRRLQASAAGRKAKRLLLENLTDEQKDDYFRKGYFFVISPSEYYPNKQPRRYVIERGFPNGNIMSVIQLRAKSGEPRFWPLNTFCFHSEEPHPLDDILLAQKFHIENDEQDFLAKANMTPAHHQRAPLEQNLRTY